MFSCGNINLKKHVACEEWLIDAKDLKIEMLDNSEKDSQVSPKMELNIQANNKMTEGKLSKSRQVEMPKPTKSVSAKLKTFFRSLKRNKVHDKLIKTDLKEKFRLGDASKRSLSKRNETSKHSILKNLRHIVKSRQDKGTGNHHKKHKHRKEHNRKENSKKKRKLEKVKRRLKREGALLNIKMEHGNFTNDSTSKGQLKDLNDNHGRSTNLSCSAIPITSCRTPGRTSDCSLFRPCQQLYNNPSILWNKRVDSLALDRPFVLKQAASLIGLLGSKQFNNSSAQKQQPPQENQEIEFTDCPQPPVMYTPLCCPRLENSNMRTYGLKCVTDAFCCNCDFWDFEKDPCLLDPFHFHDLDQDYMMKFNPVKKMCKRKAFLSSPTGVVMEPGARERTFPRYPMNGGRQDSISELVNNALQSRDGSPMCTCPRGSCMPARSPQMCCCCPMPRRQNMNRGMMRPRMQMMNRRCCCRQKGRMRSCRRNCCNKRSSPCGCDQMMMQAYPCCTGDSCGCTYESYCNNEGKQFWRTPTRYRNRIFAQSLARDRSHCSTCGSRFKTLRPRCSNCIKKMFN